MALGEFILLGKGGSEVGICCEGFYFTVDSAYTDSAGNVVLGDYGERYNTSLEKVEPQIVSGITIRDKNNNHCLVG